MEIINKIIRYIRKRIKKLFRNAMMIYFPKKYAEILYREEFGRLIDCHTPKDLNEKINWLAFNTDTSLWTALADKYQVREFVKKRGCEEILVPLYAKWDKLREIDIDKLPQSFVMKTNCGSGDVLIVKDKSSITADEVVSHFKGKLSNRLMLKSGEIHYAGIKPCIIVEKYLQQDIVDYKIWCFNGEPFIVLTVSKRDLANHTMLLNLYDLEWTPKNEWITSEYRNECVVQKPLKWLDMLRYAKILSKGFPQVRVDFYEIEGMIYFGEMTFTSAAGRMTYFTSEALNAMGDKVVL